MELASQLVSYMEEYGRDSTRAPIGQLVPGP